MDAHSPHDYLKDVALGTSIIAVSFKGIDWVLLPAVLSCCSEVCLPYACLLDAVTSGTCQSAGGVVLGADSRTSSGSYVANRVQDKITPLAGTLSGCVLFFSLR